jgi:hypothetical protein
MELTSKDVAGSSLDVQIPPGTTLRVDALSQAALEEWRETIEEWRETMSRKRRRGRRLGRVGVVEDWVDALRVAMYLGKGVRVCTMALSNVAPAPSFGGHALLARSDVMDTEIVEIRRRLFLAGNGREFKAEFLHGPCFAAPSVKELAKIMSNNLVDEDVTKEGHGLAHNVASGSEQTAQPCHASTMDR